MTRLLRRTLLCGLLLAALTALAVAADWWIAVPAEVQPTYVGRETCAACHQQQFDQWQGSHHDLAMDLATPQTVLGNFEDQQLTYLGRTSRMFRRDGKYFVNTEGPDGQPHDFEVKYVFGVDPLQQYLVQFDDGRVQVLRECWDTQAGRWFYQYPPDLRDERLQADDPLHWTGSLSNWNHMCAKCHSTGVEKNYNPHTDRFDTQFTEIDVSCETCHGPGSLHVQLATSKSLFWDRHHGYGLPRLKSEETKTEIESCALCHSRHRQVYPGWTPGHELLDYLAPSLLEEPLYYPDGQILDEVYVYGSFVQSKMHAKGVRCTDCHDPHTTRLKHEGNQVCTSCHQHPAGKYDVPAHHHHPVGSSGASCVACHMPSRHYMIVDPRRDHSLRVPRPDLSVQLGTPNACTACHLDTSQSDQHEHYQDWLAAAGSGDAAAAAEIQRVDRWCADAVQRWYGDSPQRKPHYALALAAARAGQPEAEELLTQQLRDRETPGIVRATVVAELARLSTSSSQGLVVEALADADPLVRAAAAAGLQGMGLSAEERAQALTPLLDDPVRLVRTEAARVLAAARNHVPPDRQEALLAALDEYRTGQLADRDQAAAEMNLGNLAEDLGQTRQAIRHYQTALARDDHLATARFNLGLLYTRQGQYDLAAEQYRYLVDHLPTAPLLDRERQPLLALAHHRLGLVLAMQENFAEAETHLREADRLQPDRFDFLYTLGVFYLQTGRWEEAAGAAGRLRARFPDDPRAEVLLQDARRRQPPGS